MNGAFGGRRAVIMNPAPQLPVTVALQITQWGICRGSGTGGSVGRLPITNIGLGGRFSELFAKEEKLQGANSDPLDWSR
jgi:hypothetical protein